jgi:hypothetical protein
MMIVIGILACTTTPKFEFPQGTRVGIINLLESHATHKKISSFATKNFTKTYQVGWDIPSYAENQLITQLEKDMVCLPESCLAANLGVSLAAYFRSEKHLPTPKSAWLSTK